MTERRYRFLDKNRLELIIPLINQALDIAIRETNKSQGQIAEIIGVNKNTLTNWRKGRSIPSDRDFESFLSFLGKLDPPITEDYFTGAYKDDPYTEDPDYVAAMGEELKQYAKSIGLNLNFLRYVLEIMKDLDFENNFYIFQWGPIRVIDNKVPSDPEKMSVHERLIPGESKFAKAAGDFRVGDRVLSRIDLKVINEIQDRIFEEIALRLIKRSLDMKLEVDTANEFRREKYLKAKEKNGESISDKDIVLTVGELEDIDKYFKDFLSNRMEDISDETLITEIPWDSLGVK